MISTEPPHFVGATPPEKSVDQLPRSKPSSSGLKERNEKSFRELKYVLKALENIKLGKLFKALEAFKSSCVHWSWNYFLPVNCSWQRSRYFDGISSIRRSHFSNISDDIERAIKHIAFKLPKLPRRWSKAIVGSFPNKRRVRQNIFIASSFICAKESNCKESRQVFRFCFKYLPSRLDLHDTTD